MLGQAFGLYSHMRNNRIRSGFLIAGLFALVYLTAWGLLLVFNGYVGVPRGRTAFGEAGRLFWSWFPVITLVAGAWVFIGFRMNVGIISAVSGAQGLSREDNPKLYRMLENLCISRGIPMPKLKIVDTDALNAYASGLNRRQYSVTVTSGLLRALDDQEVGLGARRHDADPARQAAQLRPDRGGAGQDLGRGEHPGPDGEFLALARVGGAEQVGAAGGAVEHRPAGEHRPHFSVGGLQHVAHVGVGVPGGVQQFDVDIADADRVAVLMRGQLTERDPGDI